MIVASLVLILGAVALLVLGLTNASSGLLVGSIGTSLLAAVALVVGVRQAAAARAAGGLEEDEQFDGDEGDDWAGRPSRYDTRDARDPYEVRDTFRDSSDEQTRAMVPVREREPLERPLERSHERSLERSLEREPIERSAPIGLSVPSQPLHDDDIEDEDPPDEPVAQRVTAADAARVARMGTEVLVIDGRPRYHVAGCVHLLGRPYEPLAVSEAVELGFSPCGLCEPDSALLADARRV